MYETPFNTDYYLFGSPYMAASSMVQDQAPNSTAAPMLTPLWWLGFLIVLIIIRVAYELM